MISFQWVVFLRFAQKSREREERFLEDIKNLNKQGKTNVFSFIYLGIVSYKSSSVPKCAHQRVVERRILKNKLG